MKDTYLRYEQGLTQLKEYLGMDHALYLDVVTLQSRFNICISNLENFGEGDPGEKAQFIQILKQLHRICLETLNIDFDAWCYKCAREKKEPHITEQDPLQLYIGNWQALQDGRMQHFLRDELLEQGIQLKTGRNIPTEDLLERYKALPLHARILYALPDSNILPYIMAYWDTIDSLSRDICDIEVSAAQLKGAEDGHDALTTSYVLKRVGFRAHSQLPGILFWNNQLEGEFIPFGQNAAADEITRLLRLLFEEIQSHPTISSIISVKKVWQGRMMPQFPTHLSVSLTKDGANEHTKLIEELTSLPTGDGKRYEALVERILKYCFNDEFAPLHLKVQGRTHNQKRIRDFVIDNRNSQVAFWQDLKSVRGVEQILFDAKNYGDPITYSQIASTLRYLKNSAFGNFIVFISRKGLKDSEEILEDYDINNKRILFLTDEDVIAMIKKKHLGGRASSIIEDKYYRLLDMK